MMDVTLSLSYTCVGVSKTLSTFFVLTERRRRKGCRTSFSPSQYFFGLWMVICKSYSAVVSFHPSSLVSREREEEKRGRGRRVKTEEPFSFAFEKKLLFSFCVFLTPEDIYSSLFLFFSSLSQEYFGFQGHEKEESWGWLTRERVFFTASFFSVIFLFHVWCLKIEHSLETFTVHSSSSTSSLPLFPFMQSFSSSFSSFQGYREVRREKWVVIIIRGREWKGQQLKEVLYWSSSLFLSFFFSFFSSTPFVSRFICLFVSWQGSLLPVLFTFVPLGAVFSSTSNIRSFAVFLLGRRRRQYCSEITLDYWSFKRKERFD